MKIFLDQYDFVPYEAVSYLAGECNYGGRVTDDKDRFVLFQVQVQGYYNIFRRCLMSVLSRVYRTETVEVENYAFDQDGIFNIPNEDGDQASYIEHCKVGAQFQARGKFIFRISR